MQNISTSMSRRSNTYRNVNQSLPRKVETSVIVKSQTETVNPTRRSERQNTNRNALAAHLLTNRVILVSPQTRQYHFHTSIGLEAKIANGSSDE